MTLGLNKTSFVQHSSARDTLSITVPGHLTGASLVMETHRIEKNLESVGFR